MANPLLSQGTLNVLRTQLIFPSLSGLNILPENMSKKFVTVALDGDLNKLINTATGAVTSPEPYVPVTITVGVLRTQSLGAAWVAQAQSLSTIGDMSAFPDSASFPEMDFSTVILKHFDPGAFDGTDPVIKLTFSGIYYVNNDLWTI